MACGDFVSDEVRHTWPKIVWLYLAVCVRHAKVTTICGVVTVVEDGVPQRQGNY